MILYIDLRTGEVRDPAIGVVGKVLWSDSDQPGETNAIDRLAMEVDDAKVNQKRDRSVF